MADQISDAILDALITDDKNSRAGVETLVKTGMVLVSGEVRTDAWVDIEEITRQVIVDIGYDKSSLGFDGNTCAVLNGMVNSHKTLHKASTKQNPTSKVLVIRA